MYVCTAKHLMKPWTRYLTGTLSTLAALLLAACASSMSTPKTIEVRLQPDQTSTVEINTSQTLIAEIEGNLTTGYRWELIALTRERRCYLFTELKPEPIVADPDKPNLAGSPSIQKWSIRIDPDFPCQRDQHISWTYRRSWEPMHTQNKTTHLILKHVSDSPSTSR